MKFENIPLRVPNVEKIKKQFNLFKEEFPFIVMLPESLLKFHQEPSCMGKRRFRSSKDKQIDIMKIKIANLFGYDVDDIEVVRRPREYRLRRVQQEQQRVRREQPQPHGQTEQGDEGKPPLHISLIHLAGAGDEGKAESPESVFMSHESVPPLGLRVTG